MTTAQSYKPGDTIWYLNSEGKPVSAEVIGMTKDQSYSIKTAAGMLSALRPDLVVDPPTVSVEFKEAVVESAKAEACETVVSSPVLKWSPEDEDAIMYAAENTAGIYEEEGQTEIAEWVILATDDAKFDIDSSSALLLPNRKVEPFPTLEEAKAFCERENAFLVSKFGKVVTPANVEPATPVEEWETDGGKPAVKQEGEDSTVCKTPRKPAAKAVISLPARMLHAVAVASKEDGNKYTTAGVQIEASAETNEVIAVATDGRRMLICTCSRGMFDVEGSIFIPSGIAQAAARMAIKPGDAMSMADVTLKRQGNKCHLNASTPLGSVDFEWVMEADFRFPPYREVVPDWSLSDGVARIGVAGALLAGTMRAIEKVVGKEPKIRVHLPPSADKPIGLESNDGDAISVVGVVMPTLMEDWVAKEKPLDGEKPPLATEAENAARAKDAENNHGSTADAGETSDPDAWKSKTVHEVLKNDKLAALLDENGVKTFGDLEELRGKRWEPKIKGLGKQKQEAIENAIVAYWSANPVERPASAAQPLEWKNPENDDFTIEAFNTAGILEANEEGTVAKFVVEPESVSEPLAYSIGRSSAYLLPIQYPESFKSIEEAKSYCERRNADIFADQQKSAAEAPPEPAASAA